MALLEEALARLQATKTLERRNSKPRLIADPFLSPRDVKCVLVDYCRQKDSSDLWSLLAPPPGCPQKFGFKSPVCGEWLLKTAGLLYSFLHICPNTKVLRQTVVRAMHMMIDSKDMAVQPGKDVEDVVDKCDVALRVLLWWLRSLKKEGEAYMKTFRSCSTADRCRMDLVMQKISLPSTYEEEEEVGEAQTYSHPVATPAASTAIVPFCKAAGQQAGGQELRMTDIMRIFRSINESTSDRVTCVSKADAITPAKTGKQQHLSAGSADAITPAKAGKPKPLCAASDVDLLAEANSYLTHTKSKSSTPSRGKEAPMAVGKKSGSLGTHAKDAQKVLSMFRTIVFVNIYSAHNVL